MASNRPPGGKPVDTRYEESMALHPRRARAKYLQAVEDVRAIPSVEIKRLRARCLGRQLPHLSEKLLAHLALLFDHPPTHDAAMLLLSDAEFNLSHAPPSGPGNTGFLGGQLPPGAPSTKAASYDIKVMNLLPWWQVYDWADHERAEKMEALKAIKAMFRGGPSSGEGEAEGEAKA